MSKQAGVAERQVSVTRVAVVTLGLIPPVPRQVRLPEHSA
jgi:hypothetical protein